MKKVLSLLLCIVLISGCTKQPPAGELPPINVLPSLPMVENKVLLDAKSFPATKVISNITDNHYSLIELNGDKLVEKWDLVPRHVRYLMCTALFIIVVATAFTKIVGLLAFFGLMRDHRDDDLKALKDNGILLHPAPSGGQ
jgi:hypothetical protein